MLGAWGVDAVWPPCTTGLFSTGISMRMGSVTRLMSLHPFASGDTARWRTSSPTGFALTGPVVGEEQALQGRQKNGAGEHPVIEPIQRFGNLMWRCAFAKACTDERGYGRMGFPSVRGFPMILLEQHPVVDHNHIVRRRWQRPKFPGRCPPSKTWVFNEAWCLAIDVIGSSV